MSEEGIQRRLAAILAADVAGYTRLMEEDTDGTVAAWKSAREGVIKPNVAGYSGKLVKLTGDGFLVEFPTVQDAVNCAIKMQEGFTSSSLDFRIGVNIGDIIDDGEDIHGEGVNVAARLEGLASPGGICISGDVYNQIRNRIEANFKDMGEQNVKNVSAPIRVYSIDVLNKANSDKISTTSTSKPSIAVLPFDNLSGDIEQEYFSDGISEDIITELSRIRQFLVIARNTTFTYKGRAVDITAVAKELGVRYVLEGSVRKAGGKVRITAQLIDGETGNHLWAEKYDRDLEDIFAVQDEITDMVVGAIGPEVGRAEQERALNKSPESLDAWDAYQRGLWHMYRFTRDDTAKAKLLFEQSIEASPRFALAHAGLSFALFTYVFLHYSEDLEGDTIRTLEAAQRSVEIDNKDAACHWVLARAHHLRRDYHAAIAEFNKSVDLNPSFAHGFYNMGWTLLLVGEFDRSIEMVDRALRLSPYDPLSFAMMMIKSSALLLQEKFDQAIEWAERAMSQPNAHEHIFAFTALCGALVGRDNVVKTAMEKLNQRKPNYCCDDLESIYYFQDSAHRAIFLEGLRKAGIPDGKSK